MTLIGTVHLGDRILIAADASLIESDGFTIDHPKLFEATSNPVVVWGYAGSQPVGEDFKAWLNGQTFTSWDDLRARASERLAELNGEAVRRAKLAEADSFERVDVLSVGFAFGVGHVVYLDDEGGATYVDDRVHFIGGGKPFAYVAFAAANRAGAPVEKAFRAAIDAAIEVVPQLGSPADVREVR